MDGTKQNSVIRKIVSNPANDKPSGESYWKFTPFLVKRYIIGRMIISFKDEETRQVFARHWSKRLPGDIQTVAYRKLAMLHAANALINLQSPPGNRLEKLHGDRSGQYSIRINERWRICFEWHATGAYNVEIVDYHS
jgi:proteic killer suppression protein